MINTSHIQKKLYDGFFSVGRQDASTRILIIGSCRTVDYLNYISILIDHYGGDLLVYMIDPHNYNWDVNGKFQDFAAALESCKADKHLLDIIANTDVFIHEYYKSFGMFNTSADYDTNIYQFGMEPKVDIRIPNWHNKYILAYDIYDRFGIYGLDEVKTIGEQSLQVFLDRTKHSSVPEFAEWFVNNWKTVRLFDTFNHVTDRFTGTIWKMVHDKYLNWTDSKEYWKLILDTHRHMSGFTPITDIDVAAYGLEWNELTIPLVTKDNKGKISAITCYDEL